MSTDPGSGAAPAGETGHDVLCRFIPDYLLQHLAGSEDPERAAFAAETLRHDAALRETRDPARQGVTAEPRVAVEGAWVVYTANNTEELPGTKVRAAGEPESGDAAVDEAGAGVQATLDMLKEVFGRDSFDGKGIGVLSTVHYGKDYVNAFWDGTQLVFGDGDGKTFDRFTKPVDVLAHELSHAVTERTAALVYQGQSGALNESVSDAFGACLKQRVQGEDAASADWLVGEGIFLPGVKGTALRSMKEPGTAYDDPAIGKDPQVGSMADYVETTEDNGGVHINSGIPNRAFYLAATAIGGTSAEGAGKIWYSALTSGIAADIDFAGFAQATVDAAGDHADAVRTAWTTVGVTPGASAPAPATPAPTTPARTVRVTRTGGFAGLRQSAELDLDGDDPRAAETAGLVDRIDFRSLSAGDPQPDRYVYEFQTPDQTVTLPEQALTGDLQRLAGIVLDD